MNFNQFFINIFYIFIIYFRDVRFQQLVSEDESVITVGDVAQMLTNVYPNLLDKYLDVNRIFISYFVSYSFCTLHIFPPPLLYFFVYHETKCTKNVTDTSHPPNSNNKRYLKGNYRRTYHLDPTTKGPAKGDLVRLLVILYLFLSSPFYSFT